MYVRKIFWSLTPCQGCPEKRDNQQIGDRVGSCSVRFVCVCGGGCGVRLFSPTNEDTQLTFHLRTRTHTKNRGRPRFLKLAERAIQLKLAYGG